MDLQTVQEIERAIAALTPEQRHELYVWLDENYSPRVDARHGTAAEPGSGSVLAEMRAIRARLQPDPQGWTTRDYIQFGRR